MSTTKAHSCRVCHQSLTVDNIYPCNITKCDWICKSCSAEKVEKRRRELSKKPKSTQQVLKELIRSRGSIANHNHEQGGIHGHYIGEPA